MSRRSRLAVGDEVGLRGSSYVISALVEGTLALTDVVGEVLALNRAGSTVTTALYLRFVKFGRS